MRPSIRHLGLALPGGGGDQGTAAPPCACLHLKSTCWHQLSGRFSASHHPWAKQNGSTHWSALAAGVPAFAWRGKTGMPRDRMPGNWSLDCVDWSRMSRIGYRACYWSIEWLRMKPFYSRLLRRVGNPLCSDVVAIANCEGALLSPCWLYCPSSGPCKKSMRCLPLLSRVSTIFSGIFD